VRVRSFEQDHILEWIQLCNGDRQIIECCARRNEKEAARSLFLFDGELRIDRNLQRICQGIGLRGHAYDGEKLGVLLVG
jgi:hypothetical protein